VDPQTLKAEPRVLMAKVNLGFGGMNGVASMSSDVLGMEPLATEPDVMRHSVKTFEKIYEEPERKQQFDRYGIWTQFDSIGGGALTSPSYGQGYALQTMLLTDHLQMADKALRWLADATYQPIPEYQLSRTSPYFFYERYYSPLAVGRVNLAAGCGALNLVNVAEPLKVARLILGVDDSDPSTTVLLPRLPPRYPHVPRRGTCGYLLHCIRQGGRYSHDYARQGQPHASAGADAQFGRLCLARTSEQFKDLLQDTLITDNECHGQRVSDSAAGPRRARERVECRGDQSRE
jgi:hypothetical protein